MKNGLKYLYRKKKENNNNKSNKKSRNSFKYFIIISTFNKPNQKIKIIYLLEPWQLDSNISS